jgi:uncharacterized membrane protein
MEIIYYLIMIVCIMIVFVGSSAVFAYMQYYFKEEPDYRTATKILSICCLALLLLVGLVIVVFSGRINDLESKVQAIEMAQKK